MSNSGKSPFDDASGQQLIKFLQDNGFAPGAPQSVVALGTTIDDAKVIGPGSYVAAESDADTGFRLDPSTPLGASIYIYNDGSDSVNIYPGNAEQRIGADSPGVATELGDGTLKSFTRFGSDLWVIFSGA